MSMKKHICPQKWTVKEIELYCLLQYFAIFDIWEEKLTRPAITANIKTTKQNNRAQKYKGYPVRRQLQKLSRLRASSPPARLQF
jgi:hypothetical protein